ncbi:MAG: glycoside hydrolase family 3 protein [Balneolales bacterium]
MPSFTSSRIPKAGDLTLEQKLGQLLLLGFHGTRITDDHPVVTDIRDHYIGGVILYDYDTMRKSHGRNIVSPEQVKRLNTGLASCSEIPLLISIDQEGGTVNRLKPEYGFPATMSHKELGEKNDPALTLQHGREIAETVRTSGHNVNFAPCVDLGINKKNKAIFGRDRCFSDDPEVVALHAAAYIQGHREAGVLTALKHFPGHGSALDDTHLGMADVTKSWREYELWPYERILEAGLCDMIMTTHVFNRNLDITYPATLSANMITGMLRERLGFEGVVISDDLQMKAITSHFGQEAAMERALMAGVDILVFGNNLEFDPGISARFVRVVKNMLDHGVITMGRINASVERILDLKKRLV